VDAGENPDVVIVLEPRVGAAEMHHRLKLLGDDRFRRISAQLRRRLIEQGHQFDLVETGLGCITITDIDDDANSCAVNKRVAFEAQSAVAGFVACRVDHEAIGVESHAVIGGDGTDFFEEAQRQLRIAITKTEQIEIAGRSMRIVEPMPQKRLP
jgi:hypothetical protein